MTRRTALASKLAALLPFAALSCGGASPPPPPPGAAGATPPALEASADATDAPTVEQARAYVEQMEKELLVRWIAGARASWVNQTYITEETDSLSAQAEEATMELVSRAVAGARRFDGLELPADVARKLRLLKLSAALPAPSDAALRRELSDVAVGMSSAYGRGKYCPPRLGGKCLSLGELSNTIATSRKPADLLDAWVGWHDLAAAQRPRFARYVELANTGAREVGFSDLGALWRSGYDMTPESFEQDVDRLWGQVKPLYDELHCYVRARLRKQYGKDVVGEKGPIPAHLLGNMWAQDWSNIYPLVAPYPGEASLDVTAKLRAKKVDPKGMVRRAESFFTSLGLDPLPDTFWDRSLFTKPKDRDVVCHASAWDLTYAGDVRIKMCIEVKEEDFSVIHHELGHDYYFMYYKTLSPLLQAGANDGFHEGVGDAIALSVTPRYLKSIGLLDRVADNPRADTNFLLKQALDKVAFLPFGLLIDKYRWDLFSGKTQLSGANEAWWKLRRELQGVSAPVPRTEEHLDAAAKYHVPANVPYVRYFLARIYQFQFHRALCAASGHEGPLHTCSIHGSQEAGKKLAAMLSMGASRPWPEALEALGAGSKADAGPMLEYFEPLSRWLADQNRGETCGY